MKSQDIVILYKLLSLHQRWAGENDADLSKRFSMRGLEAELGISRSEISNSLRRSVNVNLAMKDRKSGVHVPNRKALFEFTVYGLKYVFPAVISRMSRGIATAFAAPPLRGLLRSGGVSIFVWRDAKGEDRGEAIEPLFKSVPKIVLQDELLYEYLALVDAIRVGNPREENLAIDRLRKRMEIE